MGSIEPPIVGLNVTLDQGGSILLGHINHDNDKQGEAIQSSQNFCGKLIDVGKVLNRVAVVLLGIFTNYVGT